MFSLCIAAPIEGTQSGCRPLSQMLTSLAGKRGKRETIDAGIKLDGVEVRRTLANCYLLTHFIQSERKCIFVQ